MHRARLFAAALLMPMLATPVLAETAPASASAATFASDRISVEVVGSGPDVILIPGLSSSRDVWRGTVAALPGYRYHLVQVKGFAGAAAEANATGPVLVPVANEISRYVTAAGLKSPAVIGHSMGGSIGMVMAAEAPATVGRLMIVDMFPFLGAMFGGPDATPDAVRPIAEQVRTGMASANAESRAAQTKQTIAGMVGTESRRAEAEAATLASDPATSTQGFYDLVVTDLRPGIARYTGPVSILYVYPPGAPIPEPMYDGFMTMSYAGVKQAKITKIPDSRHFIMWDAPEAFQREVKAFLTAG